MKVLLVDNTTVYHSILLDSQADIGACELLYAPSIVEAMRLAREHEFQFYIFAWQLQDGDGLSLAKQLREAGLTRNAPVALLTASPSKAMEVAAAEAGVTEIFRKQDVDELVNFVRRFLTLYRPLNCRILYVEDARDQQLAMVSLLESWGVTVDAYSSADEAWLAFQDTPYDLLLTDVVLGEGMSGSRLINRIRRLPSAKGNLPILAVSAFDDAPRRIKLYHLGVDDYIAKPVVDVELRARVQLLLERKRAFDHSTLLLQATSLGVITVDGGGEVLSADENAARVFGLRPSVLCKRHVNDLLPELLLPEQGDLPVHFDASPRVRFRTVGKCKEGGIFPVEISIVVLDGVDACGKVAILCRDLRRETCLVS